MLCVKTKNLRKHMSGCSGFTNSAWILCIPISLKFETFFMDK